MLKDQSTKLKQNIFYMKGQQTTEDKEFNVADGDTFCLSDKEAGRKIVYYFLLYSWRKRREEIIRIYEELQCCKRIIRKFETHIHVSNIKLNMEMRNREEKGNEIKRIKNQLRADALQRVENESKITMLLSEMDMKESKMQSLFNSNTNLENELIKAYASEKVMEKLLEKERHKVNDLRKSKEELLEKMQHIESKLSKLNHDEIDLNKYRIEINNLNEKIFNLVCKENELYEYKQMDSMKTEQILLLTKEVTELKSNYIETINYKCEKLWTNLINNKKWYLHACLHCLLPAIPPPSFNCF